MEHVYVSQISSKTPINASAHEALALTHQSGINILGKARKALLGPELLFTDMSLLIPRISELLIAAFQCSAQALPVCGPRSLHLPSGGS